MCRNGALNKRNRTDLPYPGWDGFSLRGLLNSVLRRESREFSPLGSNTNDFRKEITVTEKVEASRVRQLLTRRSELMDQLAQKVRKLESARAELEGAEQEQSALQGTLDERNLQLARSGSHLPETPFQEEVEIEKIKRRKRFKQACVQVCEEDVAASQAEISGFNAELEIAFKQFLDEGRKTAKEAYIRKAMDLRQLHREFQAWYIVCKNDGVPLAPVPVAILGGFDGKAILDFRGGFDVENLGDVYSSLDELRREVHQR